MIVMNLVYFFFNLIYKPAIAKMTNYVNMFVALGFVGYELVLFIYGLSEKGAGVQQQFSVLLLAIAGVVLAVVGAWILYRLFEYVKTDLLHIGVAKLSEIYDATDSMEKDKYLNMDQTKNENVFSFFNLNKLKSSQYQQTARQKSQYKRIISSENNKSVQEDDEQKSNKNMLLDLQFNQKELDNDDDS